eukprot:3798182-Ditylum_brightwellii.AAC.1
MSLFKNKDVKKAIRASVSLAEVIENGSPAKEAAKPGGSAPYVAPKRQISMSAVLQHYLKFPTTRPVGHADAQQPTCH